MDEAVIEEAGRWLKKAKNDLRSARRLYTDEPPLLDTAVYHCQQAAEKSLKAFLALHEVALSKTHLLLPLLDQCLAHDSDFEILRDAAEILTPFATLFRYPGDMLEPAVEDVEEALTLAGMVVEFVLERMPTKVRDGISKPST